MKMREPADRRVVDAVIATFGAPGEGLTRQLSAIPQRDWRRSYYWLDASGLALYFADRVQTLGIEGALPLETLNRLKENVVDNRERVSAMFAEFVSLNNAFQAAGVDYVNVKGFAFSPESCPDPALRRALDFDFLVDGRQLQFCRELLEYRGYVLTAATGKTWEFKAGVSELARIENFYKIGPQRSVELHFSSASVSSLIQPTPCRDARLDRRVSRSLYGFSFPALAPAEQFLGQALHLFGHLCSACTRPAWLLEYTNHVRFFANDAGFWDAVREQATGDRDASIAIGLASLLSAKLFGAETPPQLDEWTIDRLPAGIRLWAEQYGAKTVLADVPGTKLYLLLHRELRFGDDGRPTHNQRRRHLLPALRAPRIVYAGPTDSLRTRVRKELQQARFVLFRARFHLVEGVRYLIEAARWKRQLHDLQSAAEHKVLFASGNPREAND